ncbi:MAG: HemK/PrmC family methyltransferase [bacterium]|nr:HemK/PrmC family methyltransferase [bacterium]
MTIDQALSQASKKLKRTKSASPHLDSEVLLSFVLKKPKEYLYSNPKKQLLRTKLRSFIRLINLRAKGWPAAYLTNNKEFYGFNFYVNKNVLVPRPETEGLVGLVLNQVSKPQPPLSILDIGTGSGNIIIALVKLLDTQVFASEGTSDVPKRSNLLTDREIASSHRSSQRQQYGFFASDISYKALAVAKKNAKKHKAKITFKKGSLLKPWKNQKFDIIIANLPYLAKEYDQSTKFEPKTALIAKKKGLALYEELFKQLVFISPPFKKFSTSSAAESRESKRGSRWPEYIFLEIGHDQGSAIKKLAKKYLPDYKADISKDLSDRNRFAVLKKTR